jgi:N-acetylneuraminic acid mutarotase
MATARSQHASSAAGGKIYVFGGTSSSGSRLASVEEYDPVANAWTARGNMPTARSNLAGCALDGRIYAMGGDGGSRAVEVFDPAANSWSARNALPTDCSECRCGVVSGKLYVIAGSGGPSSSTLEYNPTADGWTSRAALTSAFPQRGRFATVPFNSKLIVVGGLPNSGGGWISGVLAFDPVANSWAELAPMPTARGQLAAAATSTRMFAMGGLAGNQQQAVEAYASDVNAWKSKAALPKIRGDHTAEVVNGLVYVLAGSVEFATTNTVLRYDPASEP